MITLEECRKTLSKNGESYTEEQLKKILDFLKNLGDIALNQYRNSHGESSIIHQGKHG